MGNSLGTILKQLDRAKLLELCTNANKRLDDVRGLFHRRFSLPQPLVYTLGSFFKSAIDSTGAKGLGRDSAEASKAELQGTLQLCV